MATHSEVVAKILGENPALVEAATDGDESAVNRLTAKVMEASGIAPEAASATVKRAIENGQITDGIDLEGYTEYMEQVVERNDRSAWTAEAYTLSVRKFSQWYADHYDDEVPPTASHVREWIDHLAMEEDLKGSTIQRHFHGIKSYFKWAGRTGELSEIDITTEYPDRGGGTPDYLDWGEVEALREATNPDVRCNNEGCERDEWPPSKFWHQYAEAPRCPECDTTNTEWTFEPDAYETVIVQLLSGFGMRVGEMVNLDLSDVQPDSRTLKVARQKRTNDWIDPMYLLDADIAAIEAYLGLREELIESTDGMDESVTSLFVTARYSEGGWRPSGWRPKTDYIRRKLNKVAIRAGVRTYDDDGETKTDVSPHILRHSVGAKLSKNGYNEYEVGRYLGHADSTTSGRYMALSREQFEEMRQVID